MFHLISIVVLSFDFYPYLKNVYCNLYTLTTQHFAA